VPDRAHSFGYWLRRRRKALDLTQEALAKRASCSGFAIRKIEADERRPSKHLAERLAASLAIPEEERKAFLEAARALRPADRLAVASTPVEPAAAGSIPSPPALSPPDEESGPFVGRGAEHGALIGLVARLTSGRGRTVLIEGEPGIGKSRLMREVARYARVQGVLTLSTRCYEIERAIPYQSAIDLVTRALELLAPDALRKFAPVALAELAALVPAVAERCPDLPQLSQDFPEARQARLMHAIGQLVDAARGARPLVLMADDIQWADEASGRVLHYLARQTAERPLLALFAYRDEELASSEALAQLTESLRRDAGAQRMPLGRLGLADAEHMIAALDDPGRIAPGLAERLHRETQGNPFFLTSILQSIRENASPATPHTADGALLPDALRTAVRERLSRLPGEVRPVLEAAAVFGRRFDFEALLDVVGAPEAQVLDAVEALERRRLLREEAEDGVYDFSHDKVREAVYHDIGGARRRLLHRSVAEALERRGGGKPHERHARLAEHFERAHDWAKALRHLVLAGERAQALFALRDALHWLDRAVALSVSHPEALDERERLALVERRGAARAQAGQTEGAVADIERVIEAARAAGDRTRARAALIGLGMAYRRADAYDKATACLTEALADARAAGDERETADILYHLGTVAWSTGANDRAIRSHQEAVGICERAGLADLVAVQAFHGRGEAHFANAEPAPAIECYTRSLELARAIGDRSYESENLMMIGHACVGTKGLGDYPRAIASFDAALAIAREADLQWHVGPTLLGRDHALACTGRYGEAWTGMQETLRWLESLGQDRYRLIGYDLLGHLLLDLGRCEEAAECLEQGLALARETDIDFWRASIEASHAIAQVRLGRPRNVAAIEAALDRTRRASERYLAIRCLGALAEIALADGDPQRCLGYAGELLDLARPNGLIEAEADARRLRGEALLAQGERAAAETELVSAAALAASAGRVRLQMDIETALERLCATDGRQDEARRHAAKVRSFAAGIERSLAGSGLETRIVREPPPARVRRPGARR